MDRLFITSTARDIYQGRLSHRHYLYFINCYRLFAEFVLIITTVFISPVQADITRISVASDGSDANAASSNPALSANGRFVTYSSPASNLISNDTNNKMDVFVHDRITGITERISVASNGDEGNGNSISPSISADGRFIAFASAATNLVENDLNDKFDIFLHDTLSHSTVRLSISSEGTESNGDSRNWPYTISADGQKVVFSSEASNLVPNDTNATTDIFVHDLITQETIRISISSNGEQSDSVVASPVSDLPAISADGSTVVFSSFADNLVENDTNRAFDAFIHDINSRKTTRVSVSSDGVQTRASELNIANSISSNGRFITFTGRSSLLTNEFNIATNLFIHDQLTAETTRISVNEEGISTNKNIINSVISGNNNFVAFTTSASNLSRPSCNINTTNAFVKNLQTGEITRININSDGGDADDDISSMLSISSDGSVITYSSSATNLVPSDLNINDDVFVFSGDVSTDFDFDCDSLLNSVDDDDDNDGVSDTRDAFPLDASEFLDTDNDGEGNNIDLDDDNDGVIDSEDILPLDSTAQTAVSVQYYFPLVTGDEWEYVINGDLLSIVTRNLISGSTSINGVATKRMLDSDGATTYFTNDASGIRLHRIMDDEITVTFNPPLKWTNKITQAGNIIFNSGTSTLFIPGSGQFQIAYSTTAVTEGTELLQVPLGEFWAIKIKFTLNISGFINGQIIDETETDTYWLAKDIGIIKQTEEFDGQIDTLELLNVAIDHDSDGVNDILTDNCPKSNNPSQLNTDNDSLGNACDDDDDNDGVPDSNDDFPLDKNESVDTDNDGTGNNTDTDDDNDGLPDNYELDNSLNPLNQADASIDTDLDGLSNLMEFQSGTDPNNPDTDSDGINDSQELASGRNPVVNEAVIIQIINSIQE